MKQCLLLLLLAFWFCLGGRAHAQQCAFDFTTQAQVNAFPATGCTTVTGLSIRGGSVNGTGGIYDLSPLNSIRVVAGSVSLYLNDLASIEALANIKSISGSLIISNANGPNILPLSAFASLESVGGDLIILDNAGVVAISGFPLLRSVRSITITRNAALGNVGGINALGTANALYVTQCPVLRSATGFRNLTTVTPNGNYYGNITISNNPLLEEISEFPSLTTATTLTVSFNDALKKVSGFNNLKALNNFYIGGNGSLAAITGFNGPLAMGSNGIGNINGNAKLQTIAGFAGLSGKELSIHTNAELLSITGFNASKLATVNITYDPLLKTISGFNTSEVTEYIQLTADPKLEIVAGFKGAASPKNIYLDGSGLASLAEAFVYADYSLLSTLNIANNSSLTICALPWICAYLRRGGGGNIAGNGAGCTRAAILQSCQALGAPAAPAPPPADYPNPVSDVFHLGAPARYRVQDLLGRTLLRGEGGELSVADLPAGVYVVQIGTKTTRSVRLIKQ